MILIRSASDLTRASEIQGLEHEMTKQSPAPSAYLVEVQDGAPEPGVDAYEVHRTKARALFAFARDHKLATRYPSETKARAAIADAFKEFPEPLKVTPVYSMGLYI
jgi:hypothetical protein